MTASYIGLMSGTSLDGIDAVLAEFPPSGVRLIATRKHPLPEPFRQQLMELHRQGQAVSLQRIGELDQTFGELQVAACSELCRQAGFAMTSVSAIGAHGLTLWHAPDSRHPFSWQIGDPNVIAERTGLTTVADFRRRDLAAGGQGAPLVPAFHAARFRSTEENRAILNLGGIANLTLLPKDPALPVRGFDTGPGNGLMDAWISRHRQTAFDRNGDWAAAGSMTKALLEKLLSDEYFARDIPKSTGKEYFNFTWLCRQLGGETPVDVQATLAELTAASIAHAVARWAPDTERLLVCGGGTHNVHLMQRLAALTGLPVDSTAVHGLDPDWVEATAFAWLAKQTLTHQPGNIPEVTGARGARILGGIYQP